MIWDYRIYTMQRDALKVLPKIIGKRRAEEWVRNYKFPTDPEEYENLWRYWSCTLAHVLDTMNEVTKEEIKVDFFADKVSEQLYDETFNKYYKKIGPYAVRKWLENYEYFNRKEILDIKDHWQEVTEELDNMIIKKKDLYLELKHYYEYNSNLKWIKYALLHLFYLIFKRNATV